MNTKQELELAIADKLVTKEGLTVQLARIDKDLAELSEALSKLEKQPTTKK